MRNLFLVLIALLFALPACRADDSVKQGGDGEFCNNRDDDCRDGHICQDGVCRSTDAAGTITCAQMCTRLEECNTGEEDCEVNCRATIQGTCETLACPWSGDAVDSFGRCITEGLTCEEARENDAPQECYRRIPIDGDRENRCEAFIAGADRCNPGVSTSELRNRCYLLGRTSTDESWARTDACVERVAGGFCAEIENCYNSVFELSPAISLGDAVIGDQQNNVNNGINVDI